MASIKVNTTYAKRAKFFGLDRRHIIPISIFVCGSGAVCFIFTSWGVLPFAAFSLGGAIAWLLYAGDDIHGSLESLIFPGPEWLATAMPFVPFTEPGTRKRLKLKPMTKAPTITGKSTRFRNFHTLCALHALVEVEAEGEVFAFYLNYLSKKNQWQVVLPFTFMGLHSQMNAAQAEIDSRTISAAMRELPLGARLQFRMGAFDRYHEREQELEIVAAEAVTPLTTMLGYNLSARTRELSADGTRQVLVQQAYITLELGSGSKSLSFVDRLAERLASTLRGLLDTKTQHQELTYEAIASQVFEKVFLPWRYLLENKASLQLQPWSLQEAWVDLYRRFVRAGRSLQIPPLPNWLSFSLHNDRWQVAVSGDRSRDALSVLLAGAAGEPTVPQHLSSRDLVWVADRYVGVCTLTRETEIFEDELEQLSWVFRNCFGRPFSHDLEYYIEIEPENVAAARDNLMKLSKQSTQEAFYSLEDGKGACVEAEEDAAEVQDARRNLRRGHLPLKVAVTILVHRKSPEALERDCLQLCRSFGSADVTRERQVAFRLWLETLPIVGSALQTSTDMLTERRLRLDSAAIAGFFPLMAPRPLQEQGLEFVGEAGMPLHVDFVGSPTNAIVSGSKGSGKSVLLSGIAADAISRGSPVIAVDFSLGGISTFKILADFLGEHGAYLDFGSHSFNILQPPDFSRITRNRDKREQRWVDFLQEFLAAICLRSLDNPQLKQVVNNALQRLLKAFYTDAAIDRRIQEAFAGGWQSSAWRQMPVLKDMMPFLIPGRLGMDGSNSLHREAVAWIELQLQGILNNPELSRAICRPSTIPPDPLFRVFALSGMSGEENAYVLSLVAQMACIQQALAYPRSLIMLDEANRLLEKPGFAALVALIFSTFRKEGVSAMLAGQDIGTLTRSPYWSSFMANVDLMLTGKQAAGVISDYIDHLNYPPDVIERNAGETFKPRRSDRSTAWLIEREQRFWNCRYYPADQLLAAVANNQTELLARQRVFDRSDTTTTLGRLQALAQFASLYVRALSTGAPIGDIS